MATDTLYDPATQAALPYIQRSFSAGCSSSIAAIFNPQTPFSLGCILGGVISNTSGQGQIYPTGRN